jgi:ribonucleoside-diphosphate reductase alpha chain
MSLEPELSDNARIILKRRYLRRNEQAEVIEAEVDMFRRVATVVAAPDLHYNPSMDIRQTERKFYELMARMEFLPNSPTLMNAGKRGGQLSACFVLPIADSLDAIFDTVKHAALIHQTGGGTGFSFSRLRPSKDVVRSTGGIASGPISFLKVFNQATEVIKQGGTRRGANMAILDVHHPDILEFITCKKTDKDITNFNISVAVDEEFMRAVENDEEYPLINPNKHVEVKRLKARKVFDFIVNHAWLNGEPGIVFLDRINRDNPTPSVGAIEATNPCGEQPLLPYEACNLGSLNLGKCVTEDKQVDWDKLRRITRDSIHFLDNVVDANSFPLPEIDRMVRGNRKIGLGVMGWADLLFELEIPYNSNEAVELGKRVMKFIQEESDAASLDLAKQRGAFPFWEKSIWAGTDKKFRNATRTTIAPTGTISMLAGASSGIEPLFALVYIKNVMDGTELVEANPFFTKVAQREGFYSEDLMRRIAQKGNAEGFTEVPDKWERIFVTSHDIEPEFHIRMQAAFQEYTDNAVSKTVNFRREATPEDVREVFMLAFKLGCKGVTVYRDGSRDEQVLNIGKVNKKEGEVEVTQPLLPGMTIKPRPRPKIVTGATTSIETGCGKMYVTINEDEEGHPFEVFSQMGKAGGCAAAQSEGITRMISLSLRSGIDIESILKQLRGIACPVPHMLPGGVRVSSCCDAIAKAVESYLEVRGKQINGRYTLPPKAPTPNNVVVDQSVPYVPGNGGTAIAEPPINNLFKNMVDVCPDCGGSLVHDSGCVACHICGYSKC